MSPQLRRSGGKDIFFRNFAPALGLVNKIHINCLYRAEFEYNSRFLWLAFCPLAWGRQSLSDYIVSKLSTGICQAVFRRYSLTFLSVFLYELIRVIDLLRKALSCWVFCVVISCYIVLVVSTMMSIIFINYVFEIKNIYVNKKKSINPFVASIF